MKTAILALSMLMLSACGATQRSHVQATENSGNQTWTAFAWRADPKVGYDFAELTNVALSLQEGTKQVSVRLIFDLFPIVFAAGVEKKFTDVCGHRHFVASRSGSFAVNTDKIWAHLIVNNLHAIPGCLTDIKSEISVDLTTRKLDGSKTFSRFLAGRALTPSAE
jgi:hypothetical protein